MDFHSFAGKRGSYVYNMLYVEWFPSILMYTLICFWLQFMYRRNPKIDKLWVAIYSRSIGLFLGPQKGPLYIQYAICALWYSEFGHI